MRSGQFGLVAGKLEQLGRAVRRPGHYGWIAWRPRKLGRL